MALTNEEKRRFLRALEEDEEFRYAVAGIVGYGQILARLAEHDRKFEEIMERLAEHDRKFSEIMARLEEHDRKFESILARLAEHDRKFEEIVKEIRGIKERLVGVETMIERLSLTLEDEAREMVSWYLRNRGLEIELTSVEIAGAQYDIYGESDDILILGEVKTRLSAAKVGEFVDKVNKLLKIRPELREKKLIKVMYAMVVQPPAMEEARNKGVILITAKGPLSEL